MTTFQLDNNVVHFNKKFGIITNKQVIITKGTDQNKININSINNVNLIKRRVFYLNLLLLLMSISIFTYTLFFLKSEIVEMYYSLIFVSMVLLLFSLIHKFYMYVLVIKEKDHEVVELKTTQIHRKCIKEFYYKIVKQVPIKNKN